ncbi:MAG TPA: hypothetical protein VM243_02615 [Phycisphaerae bacterium]|nr:hypothetical protein [Phycisphaerae bacterium]HUU82374.1 hypothetical protein [Phycisphaerae bacterium]
MADQLMIGQIKHEKLADGSWRLTHPSGVVVKVSPEAQQDCLAALEARLAEGEQQIQDFNDRTTAIAALSAKTAVSP